MRGQTLKAAGRKLSESWMRENRSAELTAKPHVRFDVAGDENQDYNPRRHPLTLPLDG
jgi:hypothetical protein